MYIYIIYIYMYIHAVCYIHTCAVAGRDGDSIEMIESYLRAAGMFRDYSDPDQDPSFSQVRLHHGMET